MWPDDIDWDEVTEKDEGDWTQACLAFGLPECSLASLTDSPGAAWVPRG